MSPAQQLFSHDVPFGRNRTEVVSYSDSKKLPMDGHSHHQSMMFYLSTVYPGIQFTNIATHSNGETRNSMAFFGLNISAGIVLYALGNLITK